MPNSHTITELMNVFTKADYPPDETTHLSKVPYADIQNNLAHMFPDGYTVKTTHAGSANGQSWIIVEVTLPMADGKTFVFPGAAQGSISMPGLLTTAVTNAFLRHAGMGAGLYEHEEGMEPVFGNAQPLPGNPFGAADQSPNYATAPAPAPAPNGYVAAPNTGGAFPPWNGEVKIKSGNFAGLKWSQLQYDAIAGMAQKGNKLAGLELARRQASGING
jgi:hypothetical protein